MFMIIYLAVFCCQIDCFKRAAVARMQQMTLSAPAANARNRRILLKFYFDRGIPHKYDAPLMFDERLPVHIDPMRFAETGRELKGRIALSEMERFSAALLDSSGTAEAEFQFGIDHEGIHYMRGHIRTEVTVECQRCLQSLPLQLEAELLLAIVSENDERELPSNYEPLVAGKEPIFLRDIIEDELILSLPIVPKHAEGQCPTDMNKMAEDQQKDSHGTEGKKNPFAVLARLKRN
jgi:uncharacterized protein